MLRHSGENRLKYAGLGDMLEKEELAEMNEVHVHEEIEDLEVEINENEPFFLKGQTTRAGVHLSRN